MFALTIHGQIVSRTLLEQRKRPLAPHLQGKETSASPLVHCFAGPHCLVQQSMSLASSVSLRNGSELEKMSITNEEEDGSAFLTKWRYGASVPPYFQECRLVSAKQVVLTVEIRLGNWQRISPVWSRRSWPIVKYT